MWHDIPSCQGRTSHIGVSTLGNETLLFPRFWIAHNYDKEEINDEGLPFELVKKAVRVRELSGWLTRGAECWKLFRYLCQIAVKTSVERKIPVRESPIEVSQVVVESPRFITRWKRKSEDERRRGLGKYLNAIERHRLFIRASKNYIQMTDLGLALGRGLFPEIFSGKGSTKTDQPT